MLTTENHKVNIEFIKANPTKEVMLYYKGYRAFSTLRTMSGEYSELLGVFAGAVDCNEVYVYYTTRTKPNNIIHIKGVAYDIPDQNLYFIDVHTQKGTEDSVAFSEQPRKVLDNSKEFTKHDQGKLMYDLIPTSSTKALAEALTYGAKKYEPNNWQKGDVTRYTAAAFRHFEAFRSGELVDEESGLPHLSLLITNVAFLIHLTEQDVRQLNLDLGD